MASSVPLKYAATTMAVRTASDSTTDPWRTQYLDAAAWERLELDGTAGADAAELSRLVGCQQEILLARLAFAHAHGRLQLERLSPSRGGGERGPRGVSAALATDLAGIARSQGLAADAYARKAIAAELRGVLGADASAEAANWCDDDASLKVWLPSALHLAVTELARFWDVSASDVVRNLLFANLYGYLGYWRAVRSGAWVPCRRGASADVPAFSLRQLGSGEAPRTQAIREQGKSNSGFRLWCPAPMKRRLQAVATSAGATASEYSRQVLADAICGRFTGKASRNSYGNVQGSGLEGSRTSDTQEQKLGWS